MNVAVTGTSGRRGGNYQTLLEDALRKYIQSENEPLEETLRKVIREELKLAE